MRVRNHLLSATAAITVAGAFAFWMTGRPAIDPIDPPTRSTFDTELAEDGAMLAAIGACAVCHTRPGGRPLAGGLPLETPFGVIHSTNITPDPDTGIGRWSEVAFIRAMRQGVDRNGVHLYPAFPYDHFALVTDGDLQALYAFLMTRAPVAETAPENGLRFPFNIRRLLAVWNLLYLEDRPFEPDPSQDEDWNRGAYLVEGLSHCGACHSPRTVLGAVDHDRAMAGGEAEGWHAPALDAGSQTPVPWSVDALVNYLIDGWDEEHGIAAGPMKPVVDHFLELPEEEVYAIAIYVHSKMGGGPADTADAAIAFAEEREFTADQRAGGDATAASDPAFQRGEAIFANACANCHRSGGQPALLGLTSTVNAADPRNFILITLEGIRPPAGSPERTMPAFAKSLSNAQLADLARFSRAHFSRQASWTGLRAEVDAIRPE